MNRYAEQQEKSFIEEFGRRRKKQILLTLPMIGLALSFVFLAGRTKDPESAGMAAVLMPLAIVAIVAVMIFSLVNWRCPACSSSLGKSWSPNFWPKCGAQLME